VRQAVAAEAAAPLELKGKSGRISAYRLIWVAGPVDVTSRFDAPDGRAPRRTADAG
jgi:hypothetical protein